MRMFLAAYLMFLVLIPGWAGGAEFYDMDTINTLSITFSQDNWDQLLDDLYAAGNEERLEGTVEINGVTYENVGIRYKGNSSYNKDQIKNPLNSDFRIVKSH